MNYLAHLFLARHSDEAMLGALLGDFVKARLTGRYSPEIEAEIWLHRRIDAYTDRHPVVQAAKQAFCGPRRRYAGILLDVFYDHVLATRWSAYSLSSMDRFIAHFYSVLRGHRDILPETVQILSERMIERDWLGSYRSFSGVERAVRGISARLSKNGHLLRDGLSDLREHYALFRQGFEEFFPELAAFAHEQRAGRIALARL
ncbi:MAG: DUF479 domain-containing protein [Candidatus Competibacteraceae bacterium]|nr:DUF479 domain-containing protein [Candidatus Competibacteraceae bacterium]